MKAYGNIDALKKSIQKNYDEKIKEVEERTAEGLKHMEGEARERLEIMRAEAAVQLATEANVAKARTLNEEKLKAKMEFENEREKMINSIFEEIEKRKDKIAAGKEYIDHVKSRLPEGEKLEAVGGSPAYKSHFKDLKMDRGITGLLFKSEYTIYDFTIEKMVESERDRLRETAIKSLFGG